MQLAVLLLLSSALLGVVTAILLRFPRLRRSLLRPRVAGVVVLLSCVLSASSAVVRTSGASGTGTRTSYGFPKPFYFTWTSWEQSVSSAGLESLYFVGNCIAWLALVSTMTLLRAALRSSSRRLTPLARDEGRS